MYVKLEKQMKVALETFFNQQICDIATLIPFQDFTLRFMFLIIAHFGGMF